MSSKSEPGLDALFEGDLDDSDSDDESFEVDEDDVEDSDEEIIQNGSSGGSSKEADGPSPRLPTTLEGEQLSTLVHAACKAGDADELKALLEKAAEPKIRKLADGTDAPPVPTADIDELIHARDDWEVAPLHAAILARSLECIDLLLARGVSISERHEGYSYLHTAIAVGAIRANRDFSEACVDRLIAKSVSLDVEDVQGFTPLHFAAFHNDHAAVAKIIAAAVARSAGAVLEPGERTMLQRLLDTKSHNDDTAVSLALKRGHQSIADALVKAGARPPQEKPKPDFVPQPKTTVLFHNDECSQHATVDFRAKKIDIPPENANRISVLLNDDTGILHSAEFDLPVQWDSNVPEASISDILRVHEYVYVHRLSETVKKLEEGEALHLDADTLLNSHSFAAARRAAGSVIAAVDAVLLGGKRNAFCAVRPPGHHAGPYGQETCDDRGPEPFGSHGFCLLNNVAIGAAYARCVRRDAIKRVAILDFDVHHGNGTEACVRNLIPHVKTHKVKAPFLSLDSTVSVPSLRPWLQEDDANSVFFASVHGYEEKVGPSGGLFYPGTGKTESPSTSTEQSKNHQHIYNVGMRKHCRYEWRRRWEEDILEPLAQFKPDMIFISAGFDAHCRDKLNHGYIGLVQGDYTWLTTKIVEVANTCCKGRVISVLEGGYRIHGGIISPFARSVAAHVRALVRTPPTQKWTVKQPTTKQTETATTSESAKPTNTLEATKRAQPETPAEPQYPGSSQQDRKRSRRSRPTVNYVELEKKLRAEQLAKKQAAAAANANAE